MEIAAASAVEILGCNMQSHYPICNHTIGQAKHLGKTVDEITVRSHRLQMPCQSGWSRVRGNEELKKSDRHIDTKRVSRYLKAVTAANGFFLATQPFGVHDVVGDGLLPLEKQHGQLRQSGNGPDLGLVEGQMRDSNFWQ